MVCSLHLSQPICIISIALLYILIWFFLVNLFFGPLQDVLTHVYEVLLMRLLMILQLELHGRHLKVGVLASDLFVIFSLGDLVSISNGKAKW